MVNEVLIALIGATSVILGTLIGIAGQIFGNWLDHKKRIDFLVFETFFKQRLSYLERLGYGIEKVVDNESKILFLLTSLGSNIGNQKVTPQKVKNVFKDIITNSGKILEDFKLNGMSIYFSDKSPIIDPLKEFILAHTDTIVSLRTLVDSNLKDANTKAKLLASVPNNLLKGQGLLIQVRKEMLPRKKKDIFLH